MPPGAGPPVKVFILAGQSNMQGAGRVEGDVNRNEGKGRLSDLAENDPNVTIAPTVAGCWGDGTISVGRELRARSRLGSRS